LLRMRNVRSSLWELVVPEICRRLPVELERVDAWLDDDCSLSRSMAGRDHVIGGDRATWRAAVINNFLPETTKAARQAKQARPQ
jgi:hypothetical protein